MEEALLHKSQAAYFKSATKMFNGELVLTTTRVIFTGEHARIQMNHGAIGNIIRDKMETAMGYDTPEESLIDIPISEIKFELKRFGLSKRLILEDKDGQVYKLQINEKSIRDAWPSEIDKAKTASY
jgi:hypothetical protein